MSEACQSAHEDRLPVGSQASRLTHDVLLGGQDVCRIHSHHGYAPLPGAIKTKREKEKEKGKGKGRMSLQGLDSTCSGPSA